MLTSVAYYAETTKINVSANKIILMLVYRHLSASARIYIYIDFTRLLFLYKDYHI